MAVAQKTVRATEHITHNGRIYEPGVELTGRLDAEIIEMLLLHGHASEDSSKAEESAKAEAKRKADVDKEIVSRSEKREGDASA